MSLPVPQARTLITDDGVPIDIAHLPGDEDLAIIVAHGFTLSWQRPSVWRVISRMNRFGGVLSFDFRGHGRSGGASTLGDREIKDLAVVVAYARELGYARVALVGFSMGASIVLRFALGRLVTRKLLNTRIHGGRWDPVPVPPAEAAARISPVPLLIVHGDQDGYFPVEHAQQIYAAAREPKDLWVIQGYGHAEAAASAALLDRIGGWVRTAVSLVPSQVGRSA